MRWLAVLALCWPGLAGDKSLDELRSSFLIAMRGKSPDSDEGELQWTLNSELRAARLFCDDQEPCPFWTQLGYLADLSFRRSGGFLILQTAVGIECGYDESAYLYRWSEDRWRRVWQTEQNDYTVKVYKPQTIHAVLISQYNKANDYLVLTLGSEPWCTSNLHEVYYRAFRLGPDATDRPLVEGAEWAFVADDPPIHGSVTNKDVLVEFAIGGGVGGDPYQAIRHYKIDHDEVRRVDPLVLRPRDFVSEWLVHDWKEAAFWSESANRDSMRDWHGKLHKPPLSGEFIYPTMHCPKRPDLWQVGIDFSDPTNDNTYFLVRWQPPYRFTMVQVSDDPSSDCTEEDRKTDDESPTLFRRHD